MKFGEKKLEIASKKDLIEPVYNEKYLKAKKKSDNLIKSTQTFLLIKYQKKVLNLFLYQ